MPTELNRSIQVILQNEEKQFLALYNSQQYFKLRFLDNYGRCVYFLTTGDISPFETR